MGIGGVHCVLGGAGVGAWGGGGMHVCVYGEKKARQGCLPRANADLCKAQKRGQVEFWGH